MPKISRIHWREFEKFLLHIGCEFIREKGDHRIYSKTDIKRPIVIPRDTQLPPFIILNNLRTLSISREEYLEIIQKI
jgi:predicted RNA binding protein YcfA (HicA-like mRNA interferase family)